MVAEAGDATRKATIRVTYAEDGTNYSAPIDYVIQQRQLFPVKYVVDDNGTPNDTGDDETYEYLIEYEEEYLHNFDADDSYGQTEYNGMPWGLNGLQLSSQHAAAYVRESSGLGALLNTIINWIINNDLYKYDFYLKRDSPHSSSYINPDRNGLYFTEFIIESVKSLEEELDLGQQPRSAVEYCYNRNKRNADGSVANVNWYLPAIDEIEEIVMSEYADGQKTYQRFLDFQGQYYWSSMTAYERNKIDYYVWPYGTTGEFYKDDLDRARATKVVYSGGYSNVSSGVVNGKYTGVLNIRDLSPTDSPASSATSEGYWKYGEDDSFYEDGNHLRSKKNRVRCVRKR